jgi:hypothetical protein
MPVSKSAMAAMVANSVPQLPLNTARSRANDEEVETLEESEKENEESGDCSGSSDERGQRHKRARTV